MTAYDGKSYFGHLNKLVDECNNTYNRYLAKNLLMLITEKNTNFKAPKFKFTFKSKFKVGDRVRITEYRNILSECYIENWSREIFLLTN